MPLKNGHLTRQETIFADTFAATGHAAFSAAQAGYKSSGSATTQLSKPEIQESIHKQQMARLSDESLPLAVDLLNRVLRDEKETTRNQIAAAALVLKHTVGAVADAADAKAPHEMTNGEIMDRLEKLAQLRAELVERARPTIEAEANEPVAGGIFD